MNTAPLMMASTSFNGLQPSATSDELLIRPVRLLRDSRNSNHADGSSYTLSNTDQCHSEIILDYGRAEGGIPMFEISMATGSAPITFRVTYSETIDGIDSETGDGPYFLFSNAMDTYRSVVYTVQPDTTPQVIEANFPQRSQRYQRLTLTSLSCSITFSSIGLRRIRPAATIRSTFKCSNDKLNQIWLNGVRTVDMCTVAKGETTKAWDVTDDGTRVHGQHWAPCRQGTRWTDKTVTFQVRVEQHGASWGVHMVANGLIFCLDSQERTLTAFEGLSDKSAVFPAIPRGSWTLPDHVDVAEWISVKTVARQSSVIVTLNGEDVATIDELQIHPILGGAGNNSGSVAFGGPAGWISLYRTLVVCDGEGRPLYNNSLLPSDEARTLSDFAVGTNELPCTIDGAKRDRAVFGGDLHVMGRSIYYSTMDMKAVAGSIKLLTSHQTKDGYLGNLCPIQAPEHTEPEEPPTYAFYSLGYSLLLVVAIKDYWMHSGDDELILDVWKRLESLMIFANGFVNAQGLVAAPPPLSMTWFPMVGPVFGCSSQINLAFYDALNAMAIMSSTLESRDQYSTRAEMLKQNIVEHLWSEKTGILKMSLNSPEDGLSQDVNAYGISLGLSPVNSKDEQNLSCLDGTELPLAFERLAGWDKLKVVSPYATGFAVEACFERDLGRSAVSLIEKVWGLMVDPLHPNYSGGHWETMTTEGKPFHKDTSLMHGWSTWPVHLLPRYLAGVHPTQAGWKRWAVKPILAGLDFVHVTIETIFGNIEVLLHAQELAGTGEIFLNVPHGTEAELFAPEGWTLTNNLRSQKFVGGEGKEVRVKLYRRENIHESSDRKQMSIASSEISASKGSTCPIPSTNHAWVSKQIDMLRSLWAWLSKMVRSVCS